MSKLTVKERKQKLAEFIDKKSEGRLTKEHLQCIMSNLNINNQYRVIIHEDARLFNHYATLRNIKRYEMISNASYSGEEELEYLGGVSAVGETVLGELKFGSMTFIEGHDDTGTHLMDIKYTTSPEFDNKKPCAILVTSTHNYLSYDATDHQFKIIYELHIYIPSCEFEGGDQ